MSPTEPPLVAPVGSPVAPQKQAAPLPQGPIGISPIAHSTPTLAQRTRPDLPSYEQRLKELHGAFHDQGVKHTSLRKANAAASNVLLKGSTDSGHEYWAKPLAAMAHGHEPELVHKRNDASARALTAMGAEHMSPAHFQSQVPTLDRFSDKAKGKFIPSEPEDMPEKILKNPHNHMGSDAHIIQHIPDAEHPDKAPQELRDKVSGEHRLAGVLHDTLSSKTDAHGGNVSIHKSGHPVIFDNDQTGDSASRRGHASVTGKSPLTSVFHPGESLDYTKGKIKDPQTGQEREMGDIDSLQKIHEINPRAAHLVNWLAAGGHRAPVEHGGWDMHPNDAEQWQMNARDVQKAGISGALAMPHRQIVPTSAHVADPNAATQEEPDQHPWHQQFLAKKQAEDPDWHAKHLRYHPQKTKKE